VHVLVEQCLQSRTKATRVDGLDLVERQIPLKAIGHVEMTSGAQANGDRYPGEVFRSLDGRIRSNEDRPGRNAVAFAHDAAHAGAGVAHRSPCAGTLDYILLRLGIGPVLGALEIFKALPARLRAAEGLPVELDIEPLGSEIAILMRNEIVETHSLGGDL